jgi:hypothetical protein
VDLEVQTIDKSVGNHVFQRSVRTQCEPFFTNCMSPLSEKNKTLKVNITTRKNKDTSVNTEISFPPDANIQFYNVADTGTHAYEEGSDTENDAAQKEPDSDSYDYVNSSDDEESSDSDNGMENIGKENQPFDYNSSVTEPKFLVFWSSLLSLLRFCLTCFEPATITSVCTRGTLVTVTLKCSNKHVSKWLSQQPGKGNVMLSAAILYSGNSYIRISEMLSMINVAHFSQTVFYRIQKSLLFPTINTFYKRHRNEIVKQCAVREENNFIGDGRSDSPGYSAKYGTYSIMSSDLNKVVDFFVVHVSTAGNSSRREKKGLEVLLEKIQHIKITTLTTDRHVQIRAFLKNDHPNIIHQFDVWHFGKSIKKALSNLAKKKKY